MTTRTVNYFVIESAKIAGKAATLQADLIETIKASKSAVAFRKELYKAAKAKSDLAYAAVRQLFSRAIKALAKDGIKTDADKENRGKNSKTASKAKTATISNPKVEGMSDALAIARVGQLAASFLTKDDQVVMSRLLAAIDHNRKTATKSKK